VRAANPWDFLSPITAPIDFPGAPGGISVTAMRGETRAAAADIANSSGRPVEVSVTIEGLPGGVNPGYIAVHEVVWTDTRSQIPVADALRELAHDGKAYGLTIPAGMTRQLFISVKPTAAISAGSHRGRVVVTTGVRTDELVVPFAIRVLDEVFPDAATLHVGGFDYLNRDRLYGITPGNAGLLLANLREHFVDSPWATGSAVGFGGFDPAGHMATPPATDEFDRWTSRWPGARRYCIFIAATDRIGSVPLGPTFERAVGEWMTFWVEHASRVGVRPEQLFFLIVDEPHARKQDELIVRWARAIKTAQPRVMIWENPTYVDPSDGLPDLFRVSDVLVPNREMLLTNGRAFVNFYRNQQNAGRALELYSSKGPARLLDPYSYYRLQAWTCFDLGAGGSHFWAFGDSGGGSSWNEYALSGEAYTPLFIDGTSVTNSKHMAALREGVEDFEYLVLLRDRIRATEQRNPGHRLLARAVSVLQAAPRRVLGATGASELLWVSGKDRGIADAVRVEIGEILESLR
jgi:hypothetical protein